VRQTAQSIMATAQGELERGNLDGARQILDGAHNALEAVASDPALGPQALALRAELARVSDLLAKARAFADKGDCENANRIFEEVLKKHRGITQAQVEHDRCQKMMPPRFTQ